MTSNAAVTEQTTAPRPDRMGMDTTTTDLAALRSAAAVQLLSQMEANGGCSDEAADAIGVVLAEIEVLRDRVSELEAGETHTEWEIVRDKRRVLEHLRTARKFMPYLHESMPASGVVKLLGSRDRAQRALVALVQDGKVRYLETCSPDHYQAYAEMQGGPWVPVEEEEAS